MANRLGLHCLHRSTAISVATYPLIFFCEQQHAGTIKVVRADGRLVVGKSIIYTPSKDGLTYTLKSALGSEYTIWWDTEPFFSICKTQIFFETRHLMSNPDFSKSKCPTSNSSLLSLEKLTSKLQNSPIVRSYMFFKPLWAELRSLNHSEE